MIILGIDPGSRKAGYGLLELVGRKINYIDSGTLAYDKEKDFLSRLGIIHNSCLELVEKYNPDEISFESLIYVKSVTSLAKLAQARGAMISAFMQTHVGRVHEYSPNLIKSTVSGHGHANKESIEKSMKLIFGRALEFKTHDESDGVAIALTHALLKGHNKGKATRPSGGSSLRNAFKHLG
jgi:crossover junction endodeoxyribonuclease RuvC